jgi:hypothetical protein
LEGRFEGVIVHIFPLWLGLIIRWSASVFGCMWHARMFAKRFENRSRAYIISTCYGDKADAAFKDFTWPQGLYHLCYCLIHHLFLLCRYLAPYRESLPPQLRPRFSPSLPGISRTVDNDFADPSGTKVCSARSSRIWLEFLEQWPVFLGQLPWNSLSDSDFSCRACG